MSREDELINEAMWAESEEEASEAMRQLREEFDPTYHWCEDYDGLVMTLQECSASLKEYDFNESTEKLF